jgi:hypothetical protein
VRLVLLAVAVALVLAFGAGSAGATPADHLRIVVWPQGTSGPPRAVRTLTCRPAGGTLPRPGRACVELAALDKPFAPVPGGVMCSQIVSGRQVALVTGTYRGRRIWARFRRTDSCQTARWNRIDFLLQAG